MSRSVASQTGAEYVAYSEVEAVYGEYNPETGEYEGEGYNAEETAAHGEYLADAIVEGLREAFPTMREPGKYSALHQAADRECWPVLANGQCAVFLAEYCGIMSVSFVPLAELRNFWSPCEGLQRNWIQRAENKINAVIERVAGRLQREGSASNGEVFYSRV